MRFIRFSNSAAALVTLLLLWPATTFAQSVVQRGAFGAPAQVLDETNQWTTPLLMSSDHDVELYIPDISSPVWLDQNYDSFKDKQQYVLSMLTFYKTTKACRANQIGWGLGDGAHLDACVDIGYRIRRALIDQRQKTATLITAMMVDQNGEVMPDSVQNESITKTWADLDPNTQAALQKSSALITEQMKHYDHKVQNKR